MDAAYTPTAIYYQRSKSAKEEFKLIELVTERELVVEALESLIREVKEKRRELDDDTLLESFRYFNKVRDVTIALLKAIGSWQISFTKPIRPILLQCDYLIEKVIQQIDFINASKIRKIFNFQFYRGNALLLPFPNVKNETPIKVGQDLGKEIKRFSSPVEADVIACYQVLINSLPDEIYAEKLVSLEKWLLDPWVPRIWISATNKKFFTVEKPVLPRSINSPPSSVSDKDDTNKTKGGNGGSGRRTTQLAKSGVEGSQRHAAVLPAIRRRNQMLVKEAEGLLTLTNADEIGSGNVDAPLSHEDQEELKKLDFYYQELESMFLPKLGRRSVQTIVVGGNRVLPNRISMGRSGSILFSHSAKGDEQRAKIALAATNTNAFLRTNAQLIAKRDRILADRKPQDVQYQSHSRSGKSKSELDMEGDPEGLSEDFGVGSEDDTLTLHGSVTNSISRPSTGATNRQSSRASSRRSARKAAAGETSPTSLSMSTTALRDWFATLPKPEN
eukprot:gene2172-2370_t